MFKLILTVLFAFINAVAGAGGVGRFDSHDGTYNAQTDFGWYKQLYYQARTRSLIADLSRTAGGQGEVEAFSGTGLSSVIKRVKISSGDMMRFTLEENVSGLPTYGDTPVRGGQFLEFKNMEARVNNIDSPALRVVGKMSQQRVRESIQNLPAETKRQVLDYMAEQLEFEAIPALLVGGSPSVHKPLSEGGLALNLGIGNGAGAGVPLMNKNWYTPAGGFLAYNTTPATWNTAVNTAINGVDADAGHQFALATHQIIRAKLDDLLWNPVTVNGKKYKAIAGCDPDIMWRLRALLKTDYTNARERGKENPIFNVDYMIELDDVLYFSWRNLKKYRPANSSTAATGPDFGALSENKDPRGYTYSSPRNQAMVIYMGANALVEGYNDAIEVNEENARFKKGLEIAAHMQEGFVRGEWYAKDGRTSTDAVENRSVLCAAFHEPGVGQTA